MAEIRTTNDLTGGEKGTKEEAYHLLPWDMIAEDARLYKKGAEKYAERNWEKGYEVSKSFAALLRHLTQWWHGEDYDEETDQHHLASVRFHAAAMYRFTNGAYPEGLDDRPGF